MRKTLVILLISLHFVGNTEAGQLFRLPKLVTHFLQHHRQDPSIGFFDFMAMHYGGDDGTTADDDFDKQLPCHNASPHTIAMAYSPMVTEIPFIETPSPGVPVYSNRLLDGVSSKHVSLILQPPRIA